MSEGNKTKQGMNDERYRQIVLEYLVKKNVDPTGPVGAAVLKFLISTRRNSPKQILDATDVIESFVALTAIHMEELSTMSFQIKHITRWLEAKRTSP